MTSIEQEQATSIEEQAGNWPQATPASSTQVVDYFVAFPSKSQDHVLNDLIEAALTAPIGRDGRPQVAVSVFPGAVQAAKAANAIRAHCQNRKIALRVSCPAGATTVRVYRPETPFEP